MFQAQRFQSFATSSNLGIVSADAIKNSDILNTVTNELKTASDSVKDMASNLIQGALPFDSQQASSVIDSGIRSVRDTFTTLKDVTGFNQRDIEAQVAQLLPSGPMQKAFMSLSATCRSNGLSKQSGFKPFLDKIGCGQPGKQCSSGEVSNLFSNLTGGVIGAIGQAIQSILNSLIALANIGYTGGLCKIFAALAGALGAGPSVLQRGAAAMIATMGTSGNMTAVMDIASGMGSSIPSIEIPGLIGMVSGNFQAPANFSAGNLNALYDASMDTFDLIQPGWDVGDGGMASIGSLAYSDNFSETTQSYLSSTQLGDDLDTPVYSAGNEKAISYVSNVSDKDFYSQSSFEV